LERKGGGIIMKIREILVLGGLWLNRPLILLQIVEVVLL
jgi:hypothetical protein